jgi:hypothetical protein
MSLSVKCYRILNIKKEKNLVFRCLYGWLYHRFNICLSIGMVKRRYCIKTIHKAAPEFCNAIDVLRTYVLFSCMYVYCVSGSKAWK